jgi:hypothetical protein
MQCGCPECNTLMVQVEKGLDSTCKCPYCGRECRACMGRQRGANVLFEKGMSKEDWEFILKTRNRDAGD